MSVLVDVGVAILTGVGLWAVLPRGVILTRSVRTKSEVGSPLTDTWEIRNDSALPVTIVSVKYNGPDTYDDTIGRLHDVDLPGFEGPGELGVLLHYDDETLEIRRLDRAWPGLEVLPGDTLEAHVLNNDPDDQVPEKRTDWRV